MFHVEKLKEKGIHEVFDSDLENSYVIKENGQTLGYVNYRENGDKSLWLEFILAEKRGRGYGYKMLEALFSLGYSKIEGTSIYGPHSFWLEMGAEFDEEPVEDIYDGFHFVLTKENFDK